MQHLSVWLGFIGALGATAAGKHLGLATTAFLRRGQPAPSRVALSRRRRPSVVAMMLAWASYIALKDNAVSTDVLPGGIPEWWGGVIVPVAFALICVRFIWFTHGVNATWRERVVSLGACVACALAFHFGQGHPHAFFWPGSSSSSRRSASARRCSWR